MNHIVDIANTCDYQVSIWNVSGTEPIIGRIVDLLGAHINTNIFIAGSCSGVQTLQIQTADVTTSGDFTDPTSGLPAGVFPVQGRISSGGLFHANSGLYTSGYSSPAQAVVGSGPPLSSGGVQLASFQRPHRYARLNCISGSILSTFAAGFIGQKVQGQSGGGFSIAPGSGSINV